MSKKKKIESENSEFQDIENLEKEELVEDTNVNEENRDDLVVNKETQSEEEDSEHNPKVSKLPGINIRF